MPQARDVHHGIRTVQRARCSAHGAARTVQRARCSAVAQRSPRCPSHCVAKCCPVLQQRLDRLVRHGRHSLPRGADRPLADSPIRARCNVAGNRRAPTQLGKHRPQQGTAQQHGTAWHGTARRGERVRTGGAASRPEGEAKLRQVQSGLGFRDGTRVAVRRSGDERSPEMRGCGSNRARVKARAQERVGVSVRARVRGGV